MLGSWYRKEFFFKINWPSSNSATLQSICAPDGDVTDAEIFPFFPFIWTAKLACCPTRNTWSLKCSMDIALPSSAGCTKTWKRKYTITYMPDGWNRIFSKAAAEHTCGGGGGSACGGFGAPCNKPPATIISYSSSPDKETEAGTGYEPLNLALITQMAFGPSTHCTIYGVVWWWLSQLNKLFTNLVSFHKTSDILLIAF